MKIIVLKRHWRLVAANGETLAHSEQLANPMRSALRAAEELNQTFLTVTDRRKKLKPKPPTSG